MASPLSSLSAPGISMGGQGPGPGDPGGDPGGAPDGDPDGDPDGVLGGPDGVVPDGVVPDGVFGLGSPYNRNIYQVIKPSQASLYVQAHHAIKTI